LNATLAEIAADIKAMRFLTYRVVLMLTKGLDALALAASQVLIYRAAWKISEGLPCTLVAASPPLV
jgi:hypothetical protein